MNTALGNIIAKLLYVTDAVLEKFFTVTPGYLNAANNACAAQASVSVTGCGTELINNLATTVYALTNLGGEIFSALGVAAAK